MQAGSDVPPNPQYWHQSSAAWLGVWWGSGQWWFGRRGGLWSSLGGRETAVPPPGPFPVGAVTCGSCPGQFGRELLRYFCQQRWSSLKACSNNAHPEKKRPMLFLTLRRFYSESSFVLWLFLECHMAVSALHKTPWASRSRGMGRMRCCHARTMLPFRGKKLKDVG